VEARPGTAQLCKINGLDWLTPNNDPIDNIKQSDTLANLFSADFDDLIGGNPLDSPFDVTIFPDLDSKIMSLRERTLRQLKAEFDAAPATPKARQPLIKCATFGDVRTIKGALRHDDNLISVSAIEGDHDAGTMSIVIAVNLLRQAGIATLVHPTASSTPDKQRWRVIAPLADAISPTEREAFAARLNGVLQGALHPESFVASQAFYFGKTDPNAVATLTNGVTLDGLAGLDATALGKDGKPYHPRSEPPSHAQTDPFDDIADMLEPDWERINGALACIPVADAPSGDVPYDDWLTVGMALHSESRGSDGGFRKWDKWSKPGEGYDARNIRRKWEGFKGHKLTIASLYQLAKRHGWNPATGKQREPSRLTLLSPTECRDAPARDYRVKGMIADGDVGCIYGAPGAGKSLLAPHIGYAIAQGRDAFGMRTRKGHVLYVAAEDARGMRSRIRALLTRHGDAPDFTLVDGVSDLLLPDSPDLAALHDVIADRNPALIVIDTLAMAFPGLEENAAEGMGRVVEIARSLAKGGSAVILVHHDTKAQTPTPRGHSLFNGALDMALQLFPRDEHGIVRGRLTKNRNGPCDRDIAFRIATESFGLDDDGDAITAALVDELAPGSVPQGPKLTPSEQAALAVLDGMGGTVTEDAWRTACREGRAVSAADAVDARRMATTRAVRGLVTKGIVTIIDGNAGRYVESNGFDADELEELP
jgi:hypothetical protein